MSPTDSHTAEERPPTKRVSVDLTPSQHYTMRLLALQRGQSLNKVLQHAVRTALEQWHVELQEPPEE